MSNTGNKHKQEHRSENSSTQEGNIIEELTESIKKANSLSEVLKPENFAPVGGWADNITKNLEKKLNTSQLRKIFTQIKVICDKANIEDKTDLYLLYPRIVYAYARELIPKDFYELLIACLDKLKTSQDKKDYKLFGDFMTAIVAYNKRFSQK